MFNESSEKNKCKNLTKNRGLECYCEQEDKCIPCYNRNKSNAVEAIEYVPLKKKNDGVDVFWSKACQKDFYKPYTFDSLRLGMNNLE